MFAVGHLALGYLAGKAAAKGLKTSLNLPLLLAVSILPDIDLALSLFITHRSATHSLFTMTICMVPFLLMYRKAALPYFIALLSHSLVGDFFTGGSEIFWPFINQNFGMLNISITGLANAFLELALFGASLAVMVKSNDLWKLIGEKGKWDWTLAAPFVAISFPVVEIGVNWLRSGNLNFAVASLLVAPSLFWVAIMGYTLVRFVGIGKQFRLPKSDSKPQK